MTGYEVLLHGAQGYPIEDNIVFEKSKAEGEAASYNMRESKWIELMKERNQLRQGTHYGVP